MPTDKSDNVLLKSSSRKAILVENTGCLPRVMHHTDCTSEAAADN